MSDQPSINFDLVVNEFKLHLADVMAENIMLRAQLRSIQAAAADVDEPAEAEPE
ncbi:hypothetical protein JT358_11540 [Micrococcales bacterium 31B]|nr:hypothetical protein [Micrococcales bacterium 31B]